MVELPPERIVGMHRLEVGDEAGAVEDAVSKVACEGCQPSAAEKAARIAHRCLPMYPGPIRKRRAGEQDGAGQIRTDGACHHDLPSGLAIADQRRLATGFLVTACDRLDEAGFRTAHVFYGLAGDGVRQKAHEVARVARCQCFADLAVMFHAADAGCLAGAWIEDDEGALAVVDGHIGRRDDSRQAIVDRPFQRASVNQQLGIEAEDEQDRALQGVDAVFRHRVSRREERHAGRTWHWHCQPPIMNTGKRHARSCDRDIPPRPFPADLARDGTCRRQIRGAAPP